MPAPLPQTTALARKWQIDIDTANSVDTPVWVLVKGVNNLKYDPHAGSVEEDNAFDQNGRLGSTKTALDSTAELKLLRRHAGLDVTEYDPGQEALRARVPLFGEDGWAHCRIYDRFGGPEAYEDWFEILWAADGGSPTDLEKVTVTLRSKGSTTAITNPISASGS